MVSAAIVPAPWTLRGAGFVLLYTLHRSRREAVPRAFEGLRVRAGLGALIVARYSESPVGPYDELVWSPGPVALHGRKLGHSIARIVVSSAASMVSGRANWGIPKEMGRFEWRGAGGGAAARALAAAETGVLVRAANGEPLFSARFRPRAVGVRLSARGAPRTLAQATDDLLYVTRLDGSGVVRLCSVHSLEVEAERFTGVPLPRPLLALSISDLALRFPKARLLPRR